MFNRLKKLKGIGNSLFDSLSFGSVPVNQCPPLGTNVSITVQNIYDNWGFTAYDGTDVSGSVLSRTATYYNVADGNCNTNAVFQFHTSVIPQGSIVSYYNDGNTTRWSVSWDGTSSYNFSDWTMYPSYGTYIQQVAEDALVYISETDSMVKAGDALNSRYADGYGGYYTVTDSVIWYQNGTTIAVINTTNSQSYDNQNETYYDNGYYTNYVAKSNGTGWYYTDSEIGGSYFDYGVVVRTYTDVPNYSTWSNNSSYSFFNGTSQRVDRIWDGNGGFAYSSEYTAGSYYAYGTEIGQGYYDSNGSGPYTLYWSDNGGIYDSYQGGSNCDSYGTYYGSVCTEGGTYDATGNYFTGTWDSQNAYADGSCGTYYEYVGSNTNGCYYPYGFYTSYTDNPSYSNWYVYDSSSNLVAYNSFTYASYGESNMADGSGGNIYNSWNWSMNNGDQIATGEYYDSNDGMTYYYTVYYDGNGGFYVSLSS